MPSKCFRPFSLSWALITRLMEPDHFFHYTYLEKQLDTFSPDLKNELYYKKYLIFPANGTRLVLKRKKEVHCLYRSSIFIDTQIALFFPPSFSFSLFQDEVATAEAGIVFSSLSFFGKIGENIKSINSFNDFLLGTVSSLLISHYFKACGQSYISLSLSLSLTHTHTHRVSGCRRGHRASDEGTGSGYSVCAQERVIPRRCVPLLSPWFMDALSTFL